MNTKLERSEIGAISAEALVGLGITIGALGFLGLLLGWAQQMRGVLPGAMFWFVVGTAAFLIGVIIAIVGRARRRG